MTQKFGNPEAEKQVINLLKTRTEALSISSIAQELGWSWSTTKTLLLYMTFKGKVSMIDSSLGNVFVLPKYDFNVNLDQFLPQNKQPEPKKPKPTICKQCRFFDKYHWLCKIDNHKTTPQTIACEHAIAIGEQAAY